MYLMPRRYVAAVKPAISPTTPPPSAIMQSFLESLFSARKLRMERYTHQQETLNSKPEIMILYEYEGES